MRRRHLFEITDQEWCPELVRNGITDAIQFVTSLGNHYRRLVPRLRRALERAGTRRIVDMGSGGGGPWPRLRRVFEEKENFPVEVVLTDKYPNLDAFSRVQAVSGNSIRFCPDPVDAMRMPPELKGFRTLFASFHHFPPQQARAILADAVRNRQGIGIFEFTQRSPLALFLIPFAVALIWMLTPFVRPFRWSRLLLTYVIPVIPLVACFDGMVSCLRTYSPRELRKLAGELSGCGYEWEIGCESAMPFSPIPVTYMIGYPSDSTGQQTVNHQEERECRAILAEIGKTKAVEHLNKFARYAHELHCASHSLIIPAIDRNAREFEERHPELYNDPSLKMYALSNIGEKLEINLLVKLFYFVLRQAMDELLAIYSSLWTILRESADGQQPSLDFTRFMAQFLGGHLTPEPELKAALDKAAPSLVEIRALRNSLKQNGIIKSDISWFGKEYVLGVSYSADLSQDALAQDVLKLADKGVDPAAVPFNFEFLPRAAWYKRMLYLLVEPVFKIVSRKRADSGLKA